MANEASFHARITADVSQFNAEVQSAAQAIQKLIQATNASGKSAATGKGAANGVKDVFAEAKRASDAIHKQNMAQIDAEGKARKAAAGQAAKGSHLGTVSGAGATAVNDILNQVDAENRLNKTIANNGKVEMESEKLRQKAMDARLKDHQTISSLYDQTIAQEQKSRSVASANIKAQMQEQAKMNAVHAQAIRDNARFDAQAQRRQMDAMVTGRYALYDLATSYDLVGMKALQLTKAMAGTVGIAAQFETAFTSVERVLQPTTVQADKLKQSLIDLSTSIPVAFTDLTQIATLGAQMGIQASGIEQFTKTIASFSSVTGSTIDATASSFGRLSALTGTSKDEFNKLGSAILYAGNNAVATEQEVMKMSESIAGATTLAGYAADKTVGLATALASLGIAPEAARGVITRVFTDINRAVSKGGSELTAFAGTAGMTVEQMKTLWKQDPNKFFMSLLTGLSTAKDFTASLDAMGLKGTREIVTLTRLSQNMDLVNKSMNDATGAYAKGTALSDAYAKTADNLQAKIQMLKDSIQAMADSMGSGMLGPIGAVVEGLNGMSKALANFNKNPLGQMVGGMAFGLASLTTAMMLFKGASLRATAQLFALRTAMIQMDRVGSLHGGFKELFATMTGSVRAIKDATGAIQFMTKAEAAAQGQQMQWAYGNLAVARNVKLATGEIKMMTYAEAEAAGAANLWTAAAGRAATATRLFGVAMKGAGWIGLALMAAEGLGMLMSSAQKTEAVTKQISVDLGKAGGGFTSFANAVAQDSVAFTQGAGAINTWTENVIVARNDGADKMTTAVEKQTVALGQNTQQWLANAVASDPAIKKMFRNLRIGGTDVAAALKDAKFSITDLENAALKKPGKGALEFLNKSNLAGSVTSLKELYKQVNGIVISSGGKGQTFKDFAAGMSDSKDKGLALAGTLVTLAYGLDSTTQHGISAKNFLKLLGVAFSDAAGGANQFGGAVKTALEKLQDLTTKTFLARKNLVDMDSSLRSLGGSLKDSKDWKNYTEAGAANINNLLSSIDAIVTKSNGSKTKAANDLLALRKALIQMGLGSKTALALIDAELNAIGGSAKKNAKATSKAVNEMVNAITAGATDSSKATSDTIKTLSDYVANIKTVISGAFELRYGKTMAQDALTKAWMDVADSATQAKDAIKAAQAEIDQTKADKGVLQYQLDVAVRYGDEKRAAEIRAQLAKLDIQQADQQQKLTDAQDAASMVLTGNTKAAIANRAALRGLVTDYNDYLTALANSGMSSEDLKKEAEKLSSEFLAQGTALGFAKNELTPYINAFATDFTTVINNLPSDVTVKVDTDPAARAVREFVAGTNTELAKINDKTITVTTVYVDQKQNGSSGTGAQTPQQDPSHLGTVFDGMAKYSLSLSEAAGRLSWLKSVGYWATGGFIPKGTDTVPAMLSPGEFVLNRKAASLYGPDYLNAMNNMQLSRPMPSSTGMGIGGGSGIVQLSPQDRSLLRAAIERPVELYAGSTQIANSVNAGNNVIAKRGRN